MKITQEARDGHVVEFDVSDNFYQTFCGMNYELLSWTCTELCSVCVHNNNCVNKKMSLEAAGENFPFQPVDWLIIRPYFEMQHNFEHAVILCASFEHIQTNLFPTTSMEIQNEILNNLLRSSNGNEEEICDI